MRKTGRLMKILMGVCCMVLMWAATNGYFWNLGRGGLAEGLTSGTNDLDGSKIEGIRLVWVTQDSTSTTEGAPTAQEELDDTTHLYISSTGTDEIRMTYRIEVEFSGQYDYAPGDITITIPEKVWHARKYVAQEDARRTVGVVDENAYIGS